MMVCFVAHIQGLVARGGRLKSKEQLLAQLGRWLSLGEPHECESDAKTGLGESSRYPRATPVAADKKNPAHAGFFSR